MFCLKATFGQRADSSNVSFGMLLNDGQLPRVYVS